MIALIMPTAGTGSTRDFKVVLYSEILQIATAALVDDRCCGAEILLGGFVLFMVLLGFGGFDMYQHALLGTTIGRCRVVATVTSSLTYQRYIINLDGITSQWVVVAVILVVVVQTIVIVTVLHKDELPIARGISIDLLDGSTKLILVADYDIVIDLLRCSCQHRTERC